MKAWSVLVTLGVLFSGAASRAAAPMSTTNQTGYHRVHLGSFEVMALSDGTRDVPMAKLLRNIKPGEFKAALDKAALPENFETSVNTFLVNTGSKLVLVDSGCGTFLGPTVGKLLNNMKAAGYQPEQVDAVLITHMHPDHIGGLINDGKPFFPNATVYAGQADADFWLSEEKASQAPEDMKPRFKTAMSVIDPYKKAGKFKPLAADGEIVPGIKSRAARGHTPGHTTYVVEDKGAKMIFVGDLVHMAAVQFPDPSVTIQFDSEPKEAEASRKAIFAEAAKDNLMIAGAHLPFPGIGHVRTEQKGYAFIPVNYTR